MMQETYGANPRLLPDAKHASTPKPKHTLPRIPHEAHEMNWVDAIKGQQEISSPFDYAAALTEVMLLGIVSLRAGGKIHYDAANRRVTNKVKSAQQPRRGYRSEPVPQPRVQERLDAIARRVHSRQVRPAVNAPIAPPAGSRPSARSPLIFPTDRIAPPPRRW